MRAQLSDQKKRVVSEMSLVFGSSKHDLWSGETYHASPYRIDELIKIRDKHLDDLSDQELNSLMFSVISTLGSEQTLKFLLPRFFAAFFSEPWYGWTAEPWVIVSRLCRADFDSWPDRERKPVLEAVVLAVQQEKELDILDGYVCQDNLEARGWAQRRLDELA